MHILFFKNNFIKMWCLAILTLLQPGAEIFIDWLASVSRKILQFIYTEI